MKQLEIVLEIAKQAHLIAQELSGKAFDVEYKSADNSPVTTVDKALNDFIIAQLRKSFPTDMLIGEESLLDEPISSGRCWFIDPLDGTKEFIQKNGEWAIHIGLCENHIPILGIVVHSTQSRLYYAQKNCGAFVLDLKTNKTTQLKAKPKLNISDLHLVKSRSHNNPKTDLIAKYLGITNIASHGSMGLKFCKIIENKFDLYFHPKGQCSYWDTCAPQIITEEAGGCLATRSGTPLSYKKPNPYKIDEGFLVTNSPALVSQIKAQLEKL